MNIKALNTNPSARRPPGIPLPGASDLSARLVAILHSVTSLIFARHYLFAALAIPLNNRFARASRRLATLLARLANGTFRAHKHTPKSGTKGGPPPINLPRRRAWLVVKLGYHVAGFGSQLEHLLHDPQTQATLAAAPPEALKSLARTLRPLCRLLGTALPPILQPPPSPPRPPRAKPARPKPAPLPPLLPLYPQRKPRPYPFLRPLIQRPRAKIRPA